MNNLKLSNWIEPTKQNLLKICSQLKVIPEKLPPLGNVESNYAKYIKHITGLDPCPICNGPQERNRDNKIACIAYPIHKWPQILGKDPILILGKPCKHNLLLVDCPECIEKARRDNIERNIQE